MEKQLENSREIEKAISAQTSAPDPAACARVPYAHDRRTPPVGARLPRTLLSLSLAA
jgi:hypothetical protein